MLSMNLRRCSVVFAPPMLSTSVVRKGCGDCAIASFLANK